MVKNLIEKFSEDMHSFVESGQTDNQANIRFLAQQLKHINDNGIDVPSESNLADNALQEENRHTPLFKWFTLAELMSMPPKEWLIENVIGPGDLGMIFGTPGSGKTFCAIDMALSCSLGRDFAGQFRVARPLNVAYVAGEGRAGLPQRFTVAGVHYGINPAAPIANLHVTFDMPQLYEQDDPRNVEQFVTEYAARVAAGMAARPDLLFVDTLHSATSGADENSSQHMGKVIHQLKEIAHNLECAIIIVHHSNKGGNDYRGSTSLHGAMDTMIKVTGDKNPRAMSCYKLKDGEQWPQQSFSLKPQANSVYVEWGAASESSAGESQDKADGRKNDTGRRLLEMLYQAYIESKQADNPKENAAWLTVSEIAKELGVTPQAIRDQTKKLEKYMVSAPLKRKGADVTHWSLSPAGKVLWDAIKDDESIMI